jgi:SAM-dependent methyltransferase
MMTEFPQRDPSYQHWQRQAAGWERCAERMSPVYRPLTDWLVDALDPHPGQTLLELASGPGDAGFAAARRLGDGRLLQTDRSPAMVEAARRRGEALGLRNVEWAVMDALALPLADASVDGVLCRFGYMLMDDPEAALRETRRVLRAGGRLAFAVWDSIESNPWAAVAGQVVERSGYGPPPDPGEAGPFTLGDRDLVAGLVERAGFDAPRIEEIPIVHRYADMEDWWQVTVSISGRMRELGERLEPARLARMHAEIAEAFSPYRHRSRGIALPGRALAVAATLGG